MNAPIGTPLDTRLPPDVQVAGDAPWTRYRSYPVFSVPWLRGRTWLFVAVTGAFSVVTALGVSVVVGDVRGGVAAALHLFVAFVLMASAGPALATWVRHRRWPAAHERTGVVVAVLIGIALSFVFDHWASSFIAEVLPTTPKRPVTPPPHALRMVALVVNIVMLAVIYALFGGGLALRAYFGEQRRLFASRHDAQLQHARLEREQADARLGLLQAQVEPHFLFNTLASTRALVRNDPTRAEATLDALVEYLRATIPRLREGEASVLSTLGQQLDICTSYLELMRLRTGGRLAYRIEVDASLRDTAFPPLLLITLVENAVKHGIEPKRGTGCVVLHAHVDAHQLHAGVQDDGVGLSPGVGSGVGLANVRAQLATRYGDAATLQLSSPPEGGTLALLSLPLDRP